MAKHFQTKKGVLIECDIPIKQYILFLNDKDISEKKPSFIIEDLDTNHLVISSEYIEKIKQQVTDFIESNFNSDKKKG